MKVEKLRYLPTLVMTGVGSSCFHENFTQLVVNSTIYPDVVERERYH